MQKMKAVILGRNYTSLLGMIRAVGSAGLEVNVVRTVRKLPSAWKRKTLEAKSKYVNKYLYSIEPDREGLANLLLKEFSNENEKVILIPTDDFVASAIDMKQEILKKNFLFPNINYTSGAVVNLMDKGIQKKLASVVGLPTAKSWKTEIKNGKYELPRGIEYPCFTKPEISFLGDKTQMKKCDSKEELIQFMNHLAKKKDCPILIEQYIEIEKEYGVLGICDHGESIIPGVIHKLKTGSGAHKGVTLLGEIAPIKNIEETALKIEKLMKQTGFTGLFDIDLYESNGILYFNELNLRFGAFGYAGMCAGVNLPKILIMVLLEQDYSKEKVSIEKKIKCISEKVNVEDFGAGYISWSEYKKLNAQADFRFIKSKDDPNPYRAFLVDVMIHRIKRGPRKIKKLVKEIRNK